MEARPRLGASDPSRASQVASAVERIVHKYQLPIIHRGLAGSMSLQAK